MDEEWGFFIDLDYPYPYPYTYKKNQQPKYEYLTTIYEEDYWYEKDETLVKEIQPQQLQQLQQLRQVENNNQKIIPLIMYCILCASFISLSLLL
jgi:hypothetical protein